jgi:hypothetical protein
MENAVVKVKLGSAMIESNEDVAANNLAAMRSAFGRLKDEFPYVPDEALAREVFANGQNTDDEDVFVNFVRVTFGPFQED